MDESNRIENKELEKGIGLIKRNLTVFIIVGALFASLIGYIAFTNIFGERGETETELEIVKLEPFIEDVTDVPPLGSSVSKEGVTKAREHFNRGVRLSMRGQYDQAIKEYKRVLEYDPGIAEAHNNLGFAYLDIGDFDMAIQEQEKALKINPHLANAFYGLAQALEKKGDIEKAILNWERFLEFAPRETIWWNKAKERLERIKDERKGIKE